MSRTIGDRQPGELAGSGDCGSRTGPVDVSVVVPTSGRPALLARCLGALSNQTLERDRYEVLVVDDGPGDEARPIVEAFRGGGGPVVRYVSSGGGRGPAAARNAGWRLAKGRVVAFTDDDCVPARSWLAAGLDRLADGNVHGAWGRIIVPLGERPTDYERDAAGLQRAEFATANCFCLREALVESGGFDERFTSAWREDSDLFFTLLERGSPLVYAPGAIVIHPVRRARWGVGVSQQRKSMFNALLYRKHPRLYRERIQPRPPLHYYAILLSLGVAAWTWARGNGAAALAAAGLWAVLTAVFCAFRLRQTSRRFSHLVEMVVTSALIPPLSVFWRLYGAVRFRVFFA